MKNFYEIKNGDIINLNDINSIIKQVLPDHPVLYLVKFISDNDPIYIAGDDYEALKEALYK